MGWGITSFCLISNFSCEKYFNNFLDQSAVFFSWSELAKATVWLGFSVAPARARHWIPLNAVYCAYWSFTLTKAVTCFINYNKEQCEFAVHNCGLGSVSGDRKQFFNLTGLQTVVFSTFSEAELRFLRISFNGKVVNIHNSVFFFCKILFAHILTSSYFSLDS